VLDALFLAVAVASCNQGTTYDMRACRSAQDVAATAALQNALRAAVAEMRKRGLDPSPLNAAQHDWQSAKSATCTFEYDLYDGGTIAPLIALDCNLRMTQARTKRLESLRARLHADGAAPASQPVSPAAQSALAKLMSGYDQRIDAAARSVLAAAERAWTRYRDATCAVEGGACLTELDRERVAELEAGWVGEPFW
jgi:uncharacterized protein YecT (DUF1311 family)